METWPNFFIVGAPKAGTTSLYNYLFEVSGVYMSSIKEPRYFNSNQEEVRQPSLRKYNKSEYLRLFKDVKNEKAIGEATPAYLRDTESAKRIHDQVPNAHIIILLRDPIKRAFSHYLMSIRRGVEKRTFSQIISETLAKRENGIHSWNIFLDTGLYTNQIKRYLEIFDKDKVMIIIFEEFIKQPKKTVKKVLEFLGIDEEPPDSIGNVYNPAVVARIKWYNALRKNESLKKIGLKIPASIRHKVRLAIFYKKQNTSFPEEVRKTLEDFYGEDVKQLQILLGRKMPWDWIK